MSTLSVATIETYMFIGLAIMIASLFVIERKYPMRIARLEENILATLLTLITLISFVQVVMRYGFNTGFGGALELTRILFAWMILFGMSYGIRTGTHLGVDAFIRYLPKKVFRAVALFGAVCTFLYAAMLISIEWAEVFGAQSRGGAVTYWSKMYKLNLGLEDLKYPSWVFEPLGWDERVKRWIAYLIIPIGLALLGFRALQASVAIFRGDRELIIASHEAEDLVAENKDILKEDV